MIDWIPRKEASPEVESSPDLFPNMGLPSGWVAAESNSTLGGGGYENVLTEERSAWGPHADASDQEGYSPDLDPNAGLPVGWAAVESHSHPGTFVYGTSSTSPSY